MKVYPLLFFLLSVPAWGHPLDLGLLNITINGSRAEISFDVNPQVAGALLATDARHLSDAVVQSKALELLTASVGRSPMRLPEGECSFRKQKRQDSAHSELKCKIARLS